MKYLHMTKFEHYIISIVQTNGATNASVGPSGNHITMTFCLSFSSCSGRRPNQTASSEVNNLVTFSVVVVVVASWAIFHSVLCKKMFGNVNKSRSLSYSFEKCFLNIFSSDVASSYMLLSNASSFFLFVSK